MLGSYASFASHFNGGDIEYECIGPRTWKVRLTLFRDCTGVPLCPSTNCTQTMTARPSTTLNPAGCVATPNQVNFILNLVKVEDVGKSSIEVCGNTAKNTCTNLGQVTAGPYNPSVEKYIFEGTLYLSAPSLDNTTCIYWDVYWVACCRTVNIWNLANSGGQDMLIGATINIMNRSQNPCKNNSPILKNEPVFAVCSGQEYHINMGAIEQDGDSLSYEITPAMQSNGNPVIYQALGNANYPFPLNANRAPHTNYPQPNGPYVILDSTNGDISFNPHNGTASTILGNLNVRIKQWSYDANKNPILVGITSRDMQMYVVNCPTNNSPRIQTSERLPNNQSKFNYFVEAGKQLCFTVTAKDTDVIYFIPKIDTTRLSWDSALVRPGKLTFGPTYTTGMPRPREDQWQFCWQTEESDQRDLPYYFTVTARDNSCPSIGRSTRAFSIKVIQIPTFIRSVTDQRCGVYNYKIYKGANYTFLDSASLVVTTTPNDRGFTNGLRQINALAINPVANIGDTLNQPRLMFSDTFRYHTPGKYYTRFSYSTLSNQSFDPIIDSFEIFTDSIVQPIIAVNGASSFCLGDSAIVSASFTAPKYKYQWQINNQDTAGAIAQSITLKYAGAVRLKLTDTLLNCYNYSNVVNIQINPSPAPIIQLSSENVCVSSGNVGYNDISTIAPGNSITSLWNFGDGTTTTNKSGIKKFNAVGTYTIKLVVTSNNGCKDSTTKSVNILALPDATITASGNTTLCEGDSVLLSCIAYPKGRYMWRKNNSNIPDEKGNTLIAKEGASYRVFITDSFGCVNSTSSNFYVIVNPKPKVKFTLNNPIQCLNGNQYILNDSSTITSGSLSRIWSFKNDTTSQKNNTISFPTPGVYPISLLVTSNNGCSDSITRTATVSGYPDAGFINGSTIGVRTQQTYNYNVNNQLNHTYHWKIINGNIVGGQGTNNIAVVWPNVGTAQIEVVVTNAMGCSDSTYTIVNVTNDLPFISNFNPKTANEGTLVTINGVNFSGATGVSFGNVDAKSFNVVSPTLITALVDTGATGYVSVVTPKGTAISAGFTYTNSTGISEYITQSYSIFPNPVSSEIIIESDKTLNNTGFELMDVNGKVLMSTTCYHSTNQFNIDVKTLSPAVYFLRITSQGQTSTVKVVKQ
jgi:PKD repeat protein